MPILYYSGKFAMPVWLVIGYDIQASYIWDAGILNAADTTHDTLSAMSRARHWSRWSFRDYDTAIIYRNISCRKGR